MAFLYCFIGNLKKGCQYYRKAAKRPYEAGILAQIETFILWAIKRQANEYQLYYALGLYNMLLKNDYMQALKDFKVFQDKESPPKYKIEKKLSH